VLGEPAPHGSSETQLVATDHPMQVMLGRRWTGRVSSNSCSSYRDQDGAWDEAALLTSQVRPSLIM